MAAPTPIPVKPLSELLNISGTRIRQLVEEGVIVKLENGRYDLWSSVEGYIKFLQDRRVNQWDSRSEDQTDLKREQLRRTKEEADKLHLQNERTRGELVELIAVETLTEGMIKAMKSRILGMSMLTKKEQDSLLIELLSLRDMNLSA